MAKKTEDPAASRSQRFTASYGQIAGAVFEARAATDRAKRREEEIITGKPVDLPPSPAHADPGMVVCTAAVVAELQIVADLLRALQPELLIEVPRVVLD